MGDERAVALGARASLGRILDAECTLARARHPLVVPRIFQPGIESTRSALLRFDGALLDWSPVVEHLSRVLHRSVPTASTTGADPIRRDPACNNSSVFCSISSCRLGVALDT